jgi:hypothetical protein
VNSVILLKCSAFFTAQPFSTAQDPVSHFSIAQQFSIARDPVSHFSLLSQFVKWLCVAHGWWLSHGEVRAGGGSWLDRSVGRLGPGDGLIGPSA